MCVRVHCGFVCAHRKDKANTTAHTQTHTIWPDIWANVRVLVDSGGGPGRGVDVLPQDSFNLQSPSPVGSNGFHPRCQIGSVLSSSLYLLTAMFYLLSQPPLGITSVDLFLYADSRCLLCHWLEFVVPFSLSKRQAGPLGFTLPVCDHDCWTAQSHCVHHHYYSSVSIPHPIRSHVHDLFDVLTEQVRIVSYPCWVRSCFTRCNA